MRSLRLPVILFIVLTLTIFRPLLGNIWYPMHDTTAIVRTFLLEDTLRSGQIPAIWANQINYPLFHFYAPLFTYASLFFKTVTNSYFWGVKLTLMSSVMIGLLGMYQLLRTHGRLTAILGAFAFATLPYAAVNIYVRGAYAEYLSLNLLPWLFYSWTRINALRQQLFASLVTTLFLLSHNLIPFITLPFLIIWILLSPSKSLKRLIFPALLSLSLAAFFLIPLIFERHFVVADIIAQRTDYSAHFVAPSQLWNSLWGFGGSAPGLNDGMSFKLGKIHLILAIMGTFFLFRKRQYYITIAFLTACFMTTAYSKFLWEHLPLLPIIQFPWRYLSLAGFFLSLLVGYSAALISLRPLRFMYVLCALCILLFFNLKLFMPQTTFTAQLSQFTATDYLATIPTIIAEYQPVWLSQSNQSPPPDSTLINIPYYPTWKVSIDGVSAPTYPSQAGMLLFFNPSHSQNYIAFQSHTRLELFAAYLSLFSLGLFLYLRFVYVKKT